MSQAPPASASRSFHCVNDVSLCKDVVIDPRAGEANTPSTTDCPAGFFKCNSVVCGVPSVQPSPANGYVTANSAPWQAYIASDTYGYIGGGVLVNQYNVVTAAHKVSNITNKPPVSIKVSLGMYTTASTQNVQVVQVSQIWQNSGYNAQYLKNDVAILRLATPINFSANIRPICLPTAGKSYVTDSTTNCLVTGWGQTNFNVIDAPTRTLKQAYVPIVSNDKCTASYTQVLGAAYTAAYLDFPGELCAGGQAQIDACTQDGGSPLVCRDGTSFALVGLVLWGKNCGVAGRYGVYLNVPQYSSWIYSTIGCLSTGTTCNGATKIL